MRFVPPAPRLGRGEVLFSVKSFGAAMLAMYLASRAGLPRPFWALMTTYVVAHPLAGAVRSKAIYRFVGTILGSIGAVLLVPALSNSPELLTLALAVWVGGCLFISLLDRTPRSYLFMLAGYTAALIGFPSVQTPEAMFGSAVARVEEIGLGILCATLVHSLVFPNGLASSVLGLLDRTLRDARRWASDLTQYGFTGTSEDAAKVAADRRRLAADMTQLRLLSTHVPFDTTQFRWTSGALRAMQDRIAAITPTLAAVDDRLSALCDAEKGPAPDMLAAVEQVSTWAARPASEIATEDIRPLIAAIRALSQGGVADHDPAQERWRVALRIALAERLEEFVVSWRACMRMRQDIDSTLRDGVVPTRTAALSNRVLHRDYGMALLSAAAAIIAIVLCNAFWILTEWPSGSGAAMMAAVFCCFFASMDDPAPPIHSFLKFTLWSVPISAVYVLVLLPPVQDVGMLAFICAPTFLLLGLYVATPATTGPAMAMLFGVAGTLALNDTSSADMPGFINSTLAQVIGILAAACVTRLMRSVGAGWSARRIQRSILRELGEMAGAAQSLNKHAYAVRMIDRIGLLAPRIAQAGGTPQGVPVDDALRDLRVGADIVTLREAQHRAPDGVLAELLRGISELFAARGDGRYAEPTAALLTRIDTVLLQALTVRAETPAIATRGVIASLVGLRRNLFPQAAGALACMQYVEQQA